MTRVSRNVNREASLELSLNATKSLVSDYALRTRQAEEAAHFLQSNSNWTQEQIAAFGKLVATHMDRRALERSVHQQAILQSTLVALNAVLQTEDTEAQREMLISAVKDLSTSVQIMTAKVQPSSK